MFFEPGGLLVTRIYTAPPAPRPPFLLQLAEQRRSQNMIVSLLEHISEGLDRETSMPSRDAAHEMKEDLDDKAKELKAAQTTQERLREELTLRQTELEKINSLDTKISAEMAALRERMVVMRVSGAQGGTGRVERPEI